MPQTMIELAQGRAERVLGLVDELLDRSTLRSVNEPGSLIFAIGATMAWNELDDEGRRIQSRLLRELERYMPLVSVLVRIAPEKARKSVEDANKTLRELADRSHLTRHSTIAEARAAAHDAIAAHRQKLDGLDDTSDGLPIYVPDTNAVIWNPSLEEWGFDDTPHFTIVLTPTLLGELDELKMRDRNESVREKAESVIRRVKEFARRGDLNEGVALRKDRSTVRTTAVEPDFKNTLPWLDRTVKDDRLIASVLEVAREHPRSPVLLVTRDVNVQNKARTAALPFVEPPDAPPAPPREKRPRANVRVYPIKCEGGSERYVTFVADVQLVSSEPTRVEYEAHVGDVGVECRPTQDDLLVTQPPHQVRMTVPRPALAELVPQFANDPSLYERGLTLVIKVDGVAVAEAIWTELVYDEETNGERYEIQQRVWRIGRGEGTAADFRAETIADHWRRRADDINRAPRWDE